MFKICLLVGYLGNFPNTEFSLESNCSLVDVLMTFDVRDINA